MNLPREPDKVISFDLKQMQIQMFVFTLIAMLIGFSLTALIHQGFSYTITLVNFGLFLLFYIIGIILHELCHLLGFMLWGKCRWSDLVYGINRELGVAYAGTKKTLRNKAMKKALLLPFWVTGFVPFVFGIYFNNGLLLGVAALLIGGAVGDFAMYNQLRKVSHDAFIIDDLEKPQLYVYFDDPDVVN